MKKINFVLLFFLGPILVYSQTDTLILANNDLIVGEIKSMEKGVLGIETGYSDVDFKISWGGIKQVYSKVNYLITTSDGRRFNGKIRSVNDSIVEIETYIPEETIKISKKADKIERPDGGKVELPKSEIVYLNSLDEGFWSRLSFNVDAGVNLTKANDFRQYTFNTGMGYLADRWKGNLNFNNLRSTQVETDPIKRTEFGFQYNYYLPRDWYLLYYLNLLSNTEQLIDLRTSNMVGVGKYLIHTNKTYLGLSAGANFNNEKFTNEESAKQSGEAFFGANYNVFDVGDLDLLTAVVAYPSLTEQGRFRTDFKFDVRYEFKFDLFFKVGTTINYDNKPTEGATTTDYIFQTTVGWSW